MPKKLLYTWTIGSVQHTHEGFAVYTVDDKLTARDLIGPHYGAVKALEAAERLGEGHAAFRVVSTSNSTYPKELISREDLPVSVDLN